MLLRELMASLEASGVRDGRLVVAVSGGRDSVVLLDALRRVVPECGLELVVAHVNHSLRGSEADEDERFVEDLALAHDLRFRTERVDPRSGCAVGPSRSRPTLEEAARSMRRAALESIAGDEGARWIATAHHLADQAETVLMRILRGTGPEGLGAMAPIDATGRWIRPLLSTAPEAIEAWAKEAALVHREDESNADRRFARNRLRHDWLPGLARAFNPNLLSSLAQLAEAERRELEWVEGLVAEAAEERFEDAPDGLRLAIDGWEGMPEALARRLARRAMIEVGLGRDVTRAHILRVLAFLRRGRSVGRDLRLELPRGIVLRRSGNAFALGPHSEPERIDPRGNATVPRRD